MIAYSETTIGTFTLVQQNEDEKVSRKYKIQIRQCNGLACFVHIYKSENPPDSKLGWFHHIVDFFINKPSLDAAIKKFNAEHRKTKTKNEERFFDSRFGGKIEKIKLNMFFRECNILLPYFLRDGHKVECYFKSVKPKLVIKD